MKDDLYVVTEYRPRGRRRALDCPAPTTGVNTPVRRPRTSPLPGWSPVGHGAASHAAGLEKSKFRVLVTAPWKPPQSRLPRQLSRSASPQHGLPEPPQRDRRWCAADGEFTRTGEFGIPGDQLNQDSVHPSNRPLYGRPVSTDGSQHGPTANPPDLDGATPRPCPGDLGEMPPGRTGLKHTSAPPVWWTSGANAFPHQSRCSQSSACGRPSRAMRSERARANRHDQRESGLLHEPVSASPTAARTPR